MARHGDPGNVSFMNEIALSPKGTSMAGPLIRSYVQHIEAPPEVVFPLICPVREGDWLEGWADSCEVIWSASGVAEPGCVFRTSEEGRPDTIWIITTHDPDRGVVAFARVTPGLVASTLLIEVDGSDAGTSTVSIRYSIVPTSPEGVADAVARYEPADLVASIVWWERSMNHYLRTGQLLRRIDPGTPSPTRAGSPDERNEE